MSDGIRGAHRRDSCCGTEKANCRPNCCCVNHSAVCRIISKNGNPIKGIPRHPIIKDNVIIYSNATILGRITIGEGATIGGNIWVTEDVAPGEQITQIKAKQRTSENR